MTQALGNKGIRTNYNAKGKESSYDFKFENTTFTYWDQKKDDSIVTTPRIVVPLMRSEDTCIYFTTSEKSVTAIYGIMEYLKALEANNIKFTVRQNNFAFYSQQDATKAAAILVDKLIDAKASSKKDALMMSRFSSYLFDGYYGRRAEFTKGMSEIICSSIVSTEQLDEARNIFRHTYKL